MDIYKTLFHKTEDREINVYKVVDCTVDINAQYYPYVRLVSGNTCVYPIMERTMSLNDAFSTESDQKETCVTDLYNESPVFFFVYNTENYYHFIYDSLPYLISYFKLKDEIPELKLLMQYPNNQRTSFYPFVSEFLDLLGVHQEDCLLIDTKAMYRAIYISDSYTHGQHSNAPPRAEIYKFYADIVTKLKCTGNTPQKIYISRRSHIHGDLSNMGTNYTERRKLINEDNLVEALNKLGYTEIFTEKLSTTEKVLLFSQATDVIGCIGGGLVNVVFCGTKTKLTVIVSPTFLDINSRFRYCLDCVDSFYYYNTKHLETTFYKTNMRVKYQGGVGEITKITSDNIYLAWTNTIIAGWNAENEYKTISVEIGSPDIVSLDNGLNSPWLLCDIDDLVSYLQF